jgi:hypothetical protein
VQHARKALKEQQHTNGKAEEELATERRPATIFLKLTIAMMGADEGRDDRDQDDRGQFGEVASRDDEGNNRRRNRHEKR